jgi:hypothetical protein
MKLITLHNTLCYFRYLKNTCITKVYSGHSANAFELVLMPEDALI